MERRFYEIIFFETAEAFANFKEGNCEMSAKVGAVAAAEGAARNAKYAKACSCSLCPEAGSWHRQRLEAKSSASNHLTPRHRAFLTRDLQAIKNNNDSERPYSERVVGIDPLIERAHFARPSYAAKSCVNRQS